MPRRVVFREVGHVDIGGARSSSRIRCARRRERCRAWLELNREHVDLRVAIGGRHEVMVLMVARRLALGGKRANRGRSSRSFLAAGTVSVTPTVSATVAPKRRRLTAPASHGRARRSPDVPRERLLRSLRHGRIGRELFGRSPTVARPGVTSGRSTFTSMPTVRRHLRRLVARTW
jgi:hypothetical protein